MVAATRVVSARLDWGTEQDETRQDKTRQVRSDCNEEAHEDDDSVFCKLGLTHQEKRTTARYTLEM